MRFRTSLTSLQPIIDNYRNAKVEPNPFLDARGFGKEYAAELPVSLEGDCLLIIRPFCVSGGVRKEGRPVIVTCVNGEAHQARFTGGGR